MDLSFFAYAARMDGCSRALPQDELAALHAWEDKHVDGSGAFGTSDWPGWEKYIGKAPSIEPKMRDTFGYVYLIANGTGGFKIGSSKSVDRRLRQLQCANQNSLELLHQFASSDAQRDERALHEKFKHKRQRNEWFVLDEDDVAFVRSIQFQISGAEATSIKPTQPA